jgi:hypothetical protein
LTAVFQRGSFPALLNKVNDRDDFKTFGVALEMKTVDVPAASSLTENCYSQLFHFYDHAFPPNRKLFGGFGLPKLRLFKPQRQKFAD